MNSILNNYIPSVEEVRKHIDLWNHLDNYVNQERALDKLFIELCPSNDFLGEYSHQVFNT